MAKEPTVSCLAHEGALESIKKDLDTVIQAQRSQNKKLDDLLNFEGPLTAIKLQVNANTNDIEGIKIDVTELQAETKSQGAKIAELIGKIGMVVGMLYLILQPLFQGVG